jgi:hypothetical protein
LDFSLFFYGAAATFDYRILENKSYNTQIEQILELECFRTTGWVSNLYLWNIFYCNDDDDRPNTAKFYMRPIGGTTVLYMGQCALKNI